MPRRGYRQRRLRIVSGFGRFSFWSTCAGDLSATERSRMPKDPSPPVIPLMSAAPLAAITSAPVDPEVARRQIQTSLDRERRESLSRLPHRVSGALLALQGARTLIDPGESGAAPRQSSASSGAVGWCLSKLEEAASGLTRLESVLDCLARSPVPRDPNSGQRLGSPSQADRLSTRAFWGSNEAWFLSSQLPGSDGSPAPVKWVGFPYSGDSPHRHPAFVHESRHVDEFDVMTHDCFMGRARSETEIYPSVWVRVLTRTAAGWASQDVGVCLACGALLGSRDAVTLDGFEHPFLRR